MEEFEPARQFKGLYIYEAFLITIQTGALIVTLQHGEIGLKHYGDWHCHGCRMEKETLPEYVWYTEQMLVVPDADDATSS